MDNRNQNFTIIKAPKWVMTIVTTAMGAALIGGIAYLFTVVAWASAIEEKVATLEAARLPLQIQTVREDIAAIKTDMGTMKRAVERLDDKQDKIIDRLGFGTKGTNVGEAKNGANRASF